jgi:putative transposase
MDEMKPKDYQEEVALFRAEVIGALSRRDLDHGELRRELVALSKKRFRAPKAKRTRSYSVATLERWLYRYKRGGLDALRPESRSDRGRGRHLTEAQKKLLLDIRAEHRCASVPLILRTLAHQGLIERGTISAATVRRLYVEHGLDRIASRGGTGPKTRLRWQAETPGALWHADVCYGPALRVGKKKLPVRIHALLDDASRYVLAIEAMHSERESDMLSLFVRALRKHGPPDVLYLDNGSTYRGDALRLGCERLGVTLLHAAPYDPEARGKMERFWGTLRRQCLDFLGSLSTLHEVNVRLFSFLDGHYHGAPHAGLLGRAPAAVWTEAANDRSADELDEKKLRAALTVHERRRVRRDTTVSVDGDVYELEHGFLAGRVVTVGYCIIDEPRRPWVEFEGKRLALHHVNPVNNASRPRPPRRPENEQHAPRPKGATTFRPNEVLLARVTGRKPEED